MAVSDAFIDFVVEQLSPFATIAARRMFGGVGLYADGLFFAVIADNTLYFKVDDTNRPDFEAAGAEPFRPYDDERTMAYYQVPAKILEDASVLEVWMNKAVDVARRAKKK